MLLSTRIPLSSLIELCRSLRHNLGAGLRLVDVFRQQASRGSTHVRPVAERISQVLERGGDLEKALDRERSAFPPLFLDLAAVAEQTGNLPEVFGELEKYYVLQQRLRRQFWAGAAWPLIQFFLAIFVVAGLMLVLGIIAETRGPGIDGKPWDPLGLGLLGPSGAATFLAIVFGTLMGLGAVYVVLTRVLQQQRRVDALLLRVPVLGPCLLALAMTRFCLALRLTTQTDMPVTRALRLSLRATGNGAFAESYPVVKAQLDEGEEVVGALTATRLFPIDFLNILANAEEGGRMTEVLVHQTDQYQEEVGRRLTILTVAAAWLVWLLVGLLIVVVIFRIMFSYLELLDTLSK